MGDALAHWYYGCCRSLTDSDFSFRFQSLIATMLSPQTKLQLHFHNLVFKLIIFKI
jgi:endonuclease III